MVDASRARAVVNDTDTSVIRWHKARRSHRVFSPNPSGTRAALRRCMRSAALLALFIVGCGGGSQQVTTDGGDAAATSDALADALDAPLCSYPPENNDPRCPPSYSYSYGGQPCPAIGLTCAYPGAGDGTTDGCFATAMMFCHGDGGPGDLDGGVEAGAGTWTVAQ